MNSALRISVVIAWLTVTLTVNPSHAELNTFSATITPALASVIDQLPVESVNEITPHMEALASIVRGNAMYEFFQNVVDECHKYQKKVENNVKSTLPAEQPPADSENKNEKKTEKSQKEQENVLDKEIKVPEGKKVVSEPEAEPETSQSEGEAAPAAANKMPNSGKVQIPQLIKGLEEGKPYRLRTKNNAEILLLKKGDKVFTATKKAGQNVPTKQSFDFAEIENEPTRKIINQLTAEKN